MSLTLPYNRAQLSPTSTDSHRNARRSAPNGRDPSGESPKAPRKILVILHGKRAGDPAFEEGIKHLEDQGHTVKVRVTYQAGDVENFVRDAVERLEVEPYQTLVAAGGDGTISEMVAAYLHHKAPPSVSLALVPYGTCNDFAAANGVSQDPIEALQLAADASCIHRIDVGLVNGKVFMNTAAVGVGCNVDESEGGGSFWKKALGPVAVAVTGFKKLFRKGMQPTKGVLLRFPAPGKSPENPPEDILPPSALDELRERQSLQAEVGVEGSMLIKDLDEGVSRVLGGSNYWNSNGDGDLGQHVAVKEIEPVDEKVAARVGPEVVPGAELVREESLKGRGAKAAADKGATTLREVRGDLLLLAAGNSRQIARMVAMTPDAILDDGLLDVALLLGTVTEQIQEALRDMLRGGPGRMQMLRVPWVEVESSEPLEINCDGEAVQAATRVRFEVLERRIPMHLPDERMLKSGNDKTGNPPAVSARHMRPGTLWKMLTDIKVAPGSWKRQASQYRKFAFSLGKMVALVAVGWGVGYRRGKAAGQSQRQDVEYIPATKQ